MQAKSVRYGHNLFSTIPTYIVARSVTRAHTPLMNDAMKETAPAPTTLRIGAREFTVTVIDGKADCGRACYSLKGPRGASYVTMRNVHSGQMFIVHGFRSRSFGPVSGLDRVRLSDDSGALKVLS